MLEAISKSSFLSDLFNHPSEPGEKSYVGGPKYANQMGALGIRAAAAKSCPVSPAGRHFTKRSIRADQEKKEVRKRRASIYRSSPSDAVEHFLVSHVTGWAILVYPALELDTGIFPFVLFLDSLAAKFKFEFEKKMPYRESELGARRSNSCLVFVWQLGLIT